MLSKTNNRRTYKRELAFALLLGFAWVVYTGDVGMAEVIVWPIFAYVMAAFGLDSYAKQIKDRTSSDIASSGSDGVQ